MLSLLIYLPFFILTQVNEAAMVALDEKEGSVDQGSGPSVIKTSHFEQALMKISPSVSMKVITVILAVALCGPA